MPRWSWKSITGPISLDTDLEGVKDFDISSCQMELEKHDWLYGTLFEAVTISGLGDLRTFGVAGLMLKFLVLVRGVHFVIS